MAERNNSATVPPHESSHAGAQAHEATFFGFLRLDRARRRWRLVAVVAVFLFFITAYALNQTSAATRNDPHIAHVAFSGVITDTLHQQKVLAKVAQNPATKAVVVYVDSPGGTMVGGLNLHKGLRRLGAEKPVVAVMGTVAASAGYMVSVAGDHVIASPGTITGSIGVMMPLVDATELADKIGIKNDEVASGDLKTATSPLRARSKQDKAYLEDTVLQMQDVFMELVTSRRDITPQTRQKISDGRILTGVTAHDMNLVDALGNRNSARDWLEQTQNIEEDLPFVDVSLKAPKGLVAQMMYGLKTMLALKENWAKQNWQGIMAQVQ